MRTKSFKKEEPKLTKSNYYFGSWKFAAIVSGLVFYLLISQISFADEGKLDTKFTKAEIRQLIDAPRSDQRQEAAKSILNAVDFETTWAFETIIKGIQIEQDYLEHSKEINPTYVLTSWRNIQKYVRDLAFLGSYSGASLREFGGNLPPHQQIWILIAEGYQKNEMLHDELGEIIAGKGYPLQKAMAVEAISQYKDTSDVSMLFNAFLEDGNSIDWATDNDIMGFNPVGEAANKAIGELGYYIRWNGREYVLKKKEDVEKNYPMFEPGDQNE